MAKINISNLFEDSCILEKENRTADFKDSIRKRGILPILKDDKLFVYKVSGKEELFELTANYRDTMFDIYDVIVLNDQNFKSELCGRSSYLSSFRDMLSRRTSTAEEIWEKFHLDNEQSRKTFIEKNVQEVEVHIPIDDTTYTKGYRKEEIQEIVQRISQNYVTCRFKRNSKLAAIIDFVGIKNYFDLDFIASKIVEFLYSNRVDFSSGVTIVSNERMEIDRMQFTDKEKALSDDEKIAVLKKIMGAFNIECIYCEEVDKISDFQLESMLGIPSREVAMDFSKHNTDILYNSVFSNIYSKIIPSDFKTLVMFKKI